MIAEQKPIPINDYPAAHSMDTTWYAVDEEGELGLFHSDAEGDVPVLEGQESDEALEFPYSIAPPYESWVCDTHTDIEERILEAAINWAGDLANSGKYIVEQMEEAEERAFHQFGADWRGYYLWGYSPDRPMRWEDLPEELRSGRYFAQLKDYAFRSRDPINPYEHARNCYSNINSIYIDSPEGTEFPINAARRRLWRDEDVKSEDLSDGEIFFGIDAADRVAVFRTGGLGIVPLDPANHHTIWGNIWTDIVEQFEAARVVPPDWKVGPRHWLEYPFGQWYPRGLGLYHYDMSWLHAIPFKRIGIPSTPLRAGNLPESLIERMKPVRMPNADFERDNLIQPMEHGAFTPFQYKHTSDMLPHRNSQIWINSELSEVHLFAPDCVKYDSDERLLRRARKYYAIVDEMARSNDGPAGGDLRGFTGTRF